jgi:hypothetical protein
MADWLKGLLTVLIAALLLPAATATALGVAGLLDDAAVLVVVAGAVGLLYGLEAAILTIYDLARPKGWVELLIDLTWSLPNTVFGFVVGNIAYVFFGSPSRADSRGAGWIVFRPRSPTGFGNNVLQTLGTVNIGGAGQHEKMHLLQARIFGPTYLPLFALFYVVTFSLQVLWTSTLGWVLALAKVRQKAFLRPPARSAVGGFFGWIYYATPFELWAYASGNP